MASFYLRTFFLVYGLVALSEARRTATKEEEWKGNEMENDFWCPTCETTSQELCDANSANTTCPKADFCMTLWDKNVFTRKCINRQMRKLLTEDCRREGYMQWECNRGKKRYRLSLCELPGCKSKVSKFPRRHPGLNKPTENHFWCPTCQSTSQESCEAILSNTTCPKADFCMALWDQNVFARKCVNRKMLELMIKNCQNVSSNEWYCNRKRNYHVTACSQSGCKAQVSGKKVPKQNTFQCPTCPICKSSTECDRKMTISKCPIATRCMVLRFNGTIDTEGIFTRKCVNEKMFFMMQRACTYKQGCEVTSCTQSGCIATL